MNDARFQKKLKRIEAKCERKKAMHELREKYIDCYPYRVNAKTSNIMLTVIVIMVVCYFIADIILQYFTGVEISSTLTTCWFTFWGTEIIALTGIKVSKVLKNPYTEDDDAEG